MDGSWFGSWPGRFQSIVYLATRARGSDAQPSPSPSRLKSVMTVSVKVSKMSVMTVSVKVSMMPSPSRLKETASEPSLMRRC
jgi:hypothetical protein